MASLPSPPLSTTTEFSCPSTGCEFSEKPFTGEGAEIQYKRHMNKHKLLCPLKECPRSKDGNGFSRADNFKTHMKGHEGNKNSTLVLTGRIQRQRSPSSNDAHKEAVGALQKILLDTVAQLEECKKQFGDQIVVVNKEQYTPPTPPKEEDALSP